MKTALLAPLAGLLLLVASAVAADDPAQLRVALPAAPTLVEVQPGVRVIADLDLEVFQVGGAYWLRTGAGWWTAPHTTEPFTHVDPGRVPAPLRPLPPGRYRFVEAPPSTERPAAGGSVKVDPAGVKVEPALVAPTPRPAPAPGRVEPPAATPAPAPAATRASTSTTKAKSGVTSKAKAKQKVKQKAKTRAKVKTRAKSTAKTRAGTSTGKAKVTEPEPRAR
jgi:hypothetical protein